jgi:phosphoribosyl-ATP pyrophosphohydrolase/phosphoribosyl-AMP cyclohydrolase
LVKFDERGLVPAIVQDASSGKVLTLAYMNAEALRRTIKGPDVWFYSRSRQELWHKGETSGNYLRVRQVTADCDSDSVLVSADPVGPTCHTGRETCFHNPLSELRDGNSAQTPGPEILGELAAVVHARRVKPVEGSYTSKLLSEGLPRVAQKVVEEAGETAIAAVARPADLAAETADLIYHALVLLEAAGVQPDAVWKVLAERRK